MCSYNSFSIYFNVYLCQKKNMCGGSDNFQQDKKKTKRERERKIIMH